MIPLFQAISDGKMQTQTNSNSPAILAPQGFDDLRRTPRHTPNKNLLDFDGQQTFLN
jgi:hypothetical protein